MHYVIKHLILLTIQNIMGIKEVLFHWFLSLQVIVLKIKTCRTNNYTK